ncbi:inorganic phosphate transporter [Halocatena pleomorpha]|uniref:Phosphate transporter n=1 Tax=Halocatena pleomorpha TaxID=1785090 RepID=A0A3P3R4J7_9EURY|nr:inorganic phosphate transporter [Halocatena pleomorpha]RRJ28421.1 anion permease [Halocatena pleomorpha]
MESVLLLFAMGTAVFVGINIGGSSTGVAFGPAVGSRSISKLGAAALMTVFAFAGGFTWGKNVIRTISVKVVPQSVYTLEAAAGVLLFVGLALLVSNLSGVPASTSMTAVGAVAGLGVASGTLRWDVLGRIVVWWLIAPILAFWICAVVGRYLYPHLAVRFPVDQSDGSLVDIDWSGSYPRVSIGDGTTTKELLASALVIVVACYMAFAAGASNAANAVAPLVGNEAIGMNAGVVLASVAIGIGAFSIARRTLDTVGNDLTDLPILAALIVEIVSASLITFLSQLGIPASLAVSATMCIVGLGWGRATRSVTLANAAVDAVGSDRRNRSNPSASASTAEAETGDGVPEIGVQDPNTFSARELFDPSATARVVVLWMLTPSFAAVAAYLLFEFFVGL